MNLQDVARLQDLYPLLRTRSGVQIKTTEPVFELTPTGLVITVKTIFPPSQRRRTVLLVVANGGELHARPMLPHGMADAQRFAQLLRQRWMRDHPGQVLAPLRLIKNERCWWVVGPALTAPAATATPPKTHASKHITEQGAA